MKLQVLLVTYNHQEFISEALKSILMQKCNFEYAILAADDASTDRTRDIISEITDKNGIPCQFLDVTQNLGVTKNYQRAFSACTAEYVAILEGDDYWTDPCRLQKHVDFLDNHYECVMSFNQSLVLDVENGITQLNPEMRSDREYEYFTSAVLADNNYIGNFSACVYRSSFLHKLPNKIFDMCSYDWIINIYIGRFGYLGFLPHVMSVYRMHSSGEWNKLTDMEKDCKLINLIDEYDHFTNLLFHAGFENHKKRIEKRIQENKREQFLSENAQYEQKTKLLLSVKAWIPPIIFYLIKMIVPPALLNWFRK